MKKTVVLIALMVTSIANAYDFSEYANGKQYDRRTKSERLKQDDPTSPCSEFKQKLVEKTLNLKRVGCYYSDDSVSSTVRHLEAGGVMTVVKIVDSEFFYEIEVK